MTVEELRAEADKLGYYITPYRASTRNSERHFCRDCKWLDTTEKCTIGYECVCPNKRFQTRTAKWKYRHTPACRLFEEKESKDE